MELKTLRSDDAEIYYTKGHVDVEEFKSAVESVEMADYGENRFEGVSVEQGWLKAVPCNDGNYSMYYHTVKEGCKGAFKVTMVTIF